MLKTIKKQLPAAKIIRQPKTTIKRKARVTPKSKVYNPVVISKIVNYDGAHLIIYPTPTGYCFALFFRESKTDPFEIVAGSHTPYKTKAGCITAMKKMIYILAGILASDHWYAFDHRGQQVSMKIECTLTRSFT